MRTTCDIEMTHTPRCMLASIIRQRRIIQRGQQFNHSLELK